MKVLPVARTESLIVKEVDGETLVYDMKTDKAHCLNDTAARVWKNCDGQKSVSDIAQVLSHQANAEVKDEVVWLAVDQLQQFKLLKDAPPRPHFLAGMTRRQMVRAVGVAAIVLPIVTSITAPVAAQISSFPCCLNDSDCLPSQCCNPAAPCPALPSQKLCVSKISAPPGLCP